MPSPTKKTIWILTAGAFFAFFVFGFSDNLKGPVLPALLEDLHFNYALAGTILLGASLGFMIATLTAGFLADAVGHKAVLVLAGVSMAVGVAGFVTTRTAFLLTFSMACIGFGMGSLELGCNALIVNLHEASKGRYLNLMAVMHGLGSMAAPLYAGWLLTADYSWRVVYRWDLLLIGLLIVIFAAVRFPRPQAAKSEGLDFKQIGRTAVSSRMLVYYCAETLYVAFELGMASWMVEYLQKAHSLSVSRSAQALAVFFALMTAGRFLGSFVVERFGYLRSILLAALAGSACVALSLFMPDQLLFLLPVSGFFLSIIFPTITAAVSSEYRENLNSILGLLFAFAGLGGILGPWLVGVASDLGGLGFWLADRSCDLRPAVA